MVKTVQTTPPPPPPLPPPPRSSSYFSQPRHFYLAVDRLQFKMGTLVDLLGVAGRRPSLPMVVCCTSRDELDAVAAAVSHIPFISFAPLHSDLSDAERVMVLDNFRQATLEWNQYTMEPAEDSSKVGSQKSHMIVVTDACLPLSSSWESPISARVLINYELPAKKETYSRRMANCLAADGIVINMVVGGEVVTLKSIEESSGLLIDEMPMHIAEIL